jgi:hypothetical protein
MLRHCCWFWRVSFSQTGPSSSFWCSFVRSSICANRFWVWTTGQVCKRARAIGQLVTSHRCQCQCAHIIRECSTYFTLFGDRGLAFIFQEIINDYLKDFEQIGAFHRILARECETTYTWYMMHVVVSMGKTMTPIITTCVCVCVCVCVLNGVDWHTCLHQKHAMLQWYWHWSRLV